MQIKSAVLTAALLASIGTSQAAIITAEASYNYAGLSSDYEMDTSSFSPDRVSASVYEPSLELGPYAYSSGNDQGEFRMNAGGYGNHYSAETTFSYSTSVENTESSAQDFWLDLVFEGGNLSAAFGGSEYGAADVGMHAQVRVNGSTVWETGATLEGRHSANQFNVTYIGDFADYSEEEPDGRGRGELNWGEHEYNIGLGTFATLEALDIEYIVRLFVEDTSDTLYANTSARFGDPFSIGQGPFSPINISYTPVQQQGDLNAVTEPTAFALIGLGLLGLCLTRRNI